MTAATDPRATRRGFLAATAGLAAFAGAGLPPSATKAAATADPSVDESCSKPDRDTPAIVAITSMP